MVSLQVFILLWLFQLRQYISKTVTILREFVTSFCSKYRYFCTQRRSVMYADNRISRRDFIKTSSPTGGALLASTAIPGQGTKMPQYQRQSIEDFASFVRIDPTRSFISTDLGQAVMPHPVEGMRDCIVKLQSVGISQSDIDLLVRSNPAWLIGLN